MVMAAPEVNPAITGWEMKSMRKPSLKFIVIVIRSYPHIFIPRLK